VSLVVLMVARLIVMLMGWVRVMKMVTRARVGVERVMVTVMRRKVAILSTRRQSKQRRREMTQLPW
jgi:hypothetical protein